MGRMVPSVVIENDGNEEWSMLKDHPDYMNLSPDEMREKIRNAGIVGMGGAAFRRTGHGRTGDNKEPLGTRERKPHRDNSAGEQRRHKKTGIRAALGKDEAASGA